MICVNCNKEIENGTIICPHCGKSAVVNDNVASIKQTADNINTFAYYAAKVKKCLLGLVFLLIGLIMILFNLFDIIPFFSSIGYKKIDAQLVNIKQSSNWFHGEYRYTVDNKEYIYSHSVSYTDTSKIKKVLTIKYDRKDPTKSYYSIQVINLIPKLLLSLGFIGAGIYMIFIKKTKKINVLEI